MVLLKSPGVARCKKILARCWWKEEHFAAPGTKAISAALAGGSSSVPTCLAAFPKKKFGPHFA